MCLMSPWQFLERRRAELERYLRRVAAHPVLRTDPDFRDFLEQPTELPKANEVRLVLIEVLPSNFINAPPPSRQFSSF